MSEPPEAKARLDKAIASLEDSVRRLTVQHRTVAALEAEGAEMRARCYELERTLAAAAERLAAVTGQVRKLLGE